MNRKKVISLIPVLFIMTAIFIFSAQTADKSSELSEQISGEILKFGFIDNINYIVRKSAHFIIYTMLGIFMSIHLNFYKLSAKLKFFIALIICFIYASTDEFHQLFVAGRSGQFSDVLLDTGGSLTGILLYFILLYLIRHFHKK